MSFERQSVETSGKSEVRLSGGFRPNGVNPPTAYYGNWIESVVRTGIGAFTLTLKREFRHLDLVGKQCCLQLNTAGDGKVLFGPYVKTAGTQVIWTIVGAAVGDLAVNVDIVVWIELIARYGIVPDGSPTYDT